MKLTEKRLRSSRWLRGRGIEIGALHNPMPLPDGVEVTYVDRLPVDDLRRQHPGLAEAALVPVDLVCEAEELSSIPDESQDFVVANQLLEYLDDPLRGLSEMARVLKTGGILHLALSDPRARLAPRASARASGDRPRRCWREGRPENGAGNPDP